MVDAIWKVGWHHIGIDKFDQMFFDKYIIILFKKIMLGLFIFI